MIFGVVAVVAQHLKTFRVALGLQPTVHPCRARTPQITAMGITSTMKVVDDQKDLPVLSATGTAGTVVLQHVQTQFSGRALRGFPSVFPGFLGVVLTPLLGAFLVASFAGCPALEEWAWPSTDVAGSIEGRPPLYYGGVTMQFPALVVGLAVALSLVRSPTVLNGACPCSLGSAKDNSGISVVQPASVMGVAVPLGSGGLSTVFNATGGLWASHGYMVTGSVPEKQRLGTEEALTLFKNDRNVLTGGQ